MKRLVAGLFFGWAMVGGVGQTPCGDRSTQEIAVPKKLGRGLLGFDKITFDFEREGLQPPRWGFEISSGGSGRYYQGGAVTDGKGLGNEWQDVSVSPATMTQLRAGAERGEAVCETKSKKLAQTGKKVLTYWHGDAPWTCTFNYSDNAGVMKTAETFEAMAETMQYGARLQHAHRFDRLGLDAEVDSLVGSVKDGRAIEVQNIGPALQSIAEDERVMERVRRKAARLMEGKN